MLAGAIGGAYSFILLLELPFALVFLSKFAAAALIVLAAFRFRSVTGFVASYFAFFAMNYAFLGVVYGIASLSESPYITLSNGTVYVNVSSRGLVVSAFVAYVVSCVVVRLYNRRLSAGEIYKLTVENNGKSVTVYAFSDSGNKLREPFSDFPVIVADAAKLSPLVTPGKTRIIPTETVNKSAFLLSFRPERVVVKTERGEHEIENVYIALSDEIKNDAFSAVVNPEILSV